MRDIYKERTKDPNEKGRCGGAVASLRNFNETKSEFEHASPGFDSVGDSLTTQIIIKVFIFSKT